MKKQSASLFSVLFLVCIILFACHDKDKEEEWFANLPELSVDSVSMSGLIGISNALTF